MKPSRYHLFTLVALFSLSLNIYADDKTESKIDALDKSKTALDQSEKESARLNREAFFYEHATDLRNPTAIGKILFANNISKNNISAGRLIENTYTEEEMTLDILMVNGDTCRITVSSWKSFFELFYKTGGQIICLNSNKEVIKRASYGDDQLSDISQAYSLKNLEGLVKVGR